MPIPIEGEDSEEYSPLEEAYSNIEAYRKRIAELEAENAALKTDLAARIASGCVVHGLRVRELEAENAALRAEREPSEQQKADIACLRNRVASWDDIPYSDEAQGRLQYDDVNALARVLDEGI